MEGKKTWRRRVNRYTPLTTAIAGILVVFVGVILVAGAAAQIATVAAGLVVLEAGVWYMANPIFTSERRYLHLRDELDNMIDLVRKLNRAALKPGAEEELKGLRSAMHESVDRMVEVAGVEGRASAPRPAA